MIRAACLEPKTSIVIPQHNLRRGASSVECYILQTDYSSVDEPLSSCDLNLLEAFDFLAEQLSPSRLRNAPNESAQ